jgi:AcrR family transcriptional regulator
MTTSPTTKRPYRSPLREAQAEATRRRVVEAATELFGRQGFPVTTIGEIARAAQVSPETVYGQFGSKQGVLEGVVAMFAGERFPRAAFEEQVLRLGDDVAARLSHLVDVMGDFYAANPDLIALFAHAPGEAGAAFDAFRDARYGDQAIIYAELPPGTLKPGLTPRRALEMTDVLLAPAIYARLVDTAGWSLADYKRQVLELLEVALLPPR